MSASPRLLIVEDDFELAMVLGAELAHAGYQCELASTADAALAQVDRIAFHAVIADWRMDGLSGVELLNALTNAQPKLPVIVMTGSTESRAVEAMNGGAFHYLTKPFDVDELSGVIAQAIGDSQDEIAGRSPAQKKNTLLALGASSRALLRRVERLASSEASVLISGETGSGKELVARAIHERSVRASAPFVAINVAAIPEALVESEIFGHARGAFSGATQARPGLVAQANHGTLLLDEIGEMPYALQAKLLRVLQSGEIRPVGGDQSTVVNVRFLAATHRDLRLLVKEGKFREDLYFRLHVLELLVPPLRERKSEIPALVAHFLRAARRRNPNAVVRSLSPEAMGALVRASWPGNVRELASFVERLVVMGDQAVVNESDLSGMGFVPTNEGRACGAAERDEELSTIEVRNRAYVDLVLARTNDDKAAAARILGINLSTLYRWLKARNS
jgi:two-component system response regulator HydG